MIYYLIIMYNIMVLYHFIFNNFFCFDDILVLELRQPIRIGISTLSLGTYIHSSKGKFERSYNNN